MADDVVDYNNGMAPGATKACRHHRALDGHHGHHWRRSNLTSATFKSSTSSSVDTRWISVHQRKEFHHYRLNGGGQHVVWPNNNARNRRQNCLQELFPIALCWGIHFGRGGEQPEAQIGAMDSRTDCACSPIAMCGRLTMKAASLFGTGQSLEGLGLAWRASQKAHFRIQAIAPDGAVQVLDVW